MDEFHHASQAFLAEFTSQPLSTLHEHVSITDLRSSRRGRAMLATSNIPPETILFTIPRSYVISVSNSELSSKLPQLFQPTGPETPSATGGSSDGDNDEEKYEDESDLDSIMPQSWLNLILVMVYEYFHRETSKWKAYWNVLPDSFDTLMFWSESDLGELQASHVRGLIGRASADRMFKSKILPVLKQHRDVFFPSDSKSYDLTDEELLKLAHRMGSLIMAYAFDLELSNDDDGNEGEGEDAEDGWTEDKDGQTAMGMVPVADMLNADAEFNAHLEHGDEVLTMRSLREIKDGDEVLNYYGPLPNCDLVRRYGYTSSLHARYDVVEIAWSLIEQVIKDTFHDSIRQARFEFDALDRLEDSFLLERESGDPDETGLNPPEARFTMFPEELVEQVNLFTSVALGLDEKTPDRDDGRRLKKVFLQVMSKVIPVRLREYGTTLEEDEALLTTTASQGRLRMALDVRMGEKKLLMEAATHVERLLEKYGDVEGKNQRQEEPPTKRQKKTR